MFLESEKYSWIFFNTVFVVFFLIGRVLRNYVFSFIALKYNSTRLRRSWPPASPSWRRRRSAPTWVRPRSSSWRRSWGLSPTTSSLSRSLRTWQLFVSWLYILQVAEEKANQREKTYKEQIKTLSAKLKQAEARAEFAEKSVQKLQKEVKFSFQSIS